MSGQILGPMPRTSSSATLTDITGSDSRGEACILELLEEGNVAIAIECVKDCIGCSFLNLADDCAELCAAQRDILFASQLNTHRFQLLLDDQVGGAWEDVI